MIKPTRPEKFRLPAPALPALLALFGIGCVMPDQVSQMQKDLADVQQQLAAIQQDQDEARQLMSDLRQTSRGGEERVSRADIADLDLRIDQTARNVEITDERLRDVGRRLDTLSTKVDEAIDLARRSGSPLVIPETIGEDDPGGEMATGAPGPGIDPNELYNTAYADFSKGNYELAVQGFEEFYTSFPDNNVADNALYWVGECYFSQGDFPSAVRAFDRMLKAFPEGDKAAAANLKKGLAYLEQNQIGQAIVQLEHVRTAYPSSDEARVARDKLSSLGQRG